MDGEGTPGAWRPEFAHVAVLVSDLDRSRAWYRAVLGWEQEFTAEQGPVLGEANGHGGRGTIAMGRVGGTRVELVAMHDHAGAAWRRSERCGLMLISVRVADVADARRRCAATGTPVVREVDFAGTTLLVVADPDGTEIGIVRR